MTDPIPLLPPAGGHAFDPATAAPHSAATPCWVQMSTTPLHTALGGVGQNHIGPAATVWPTGQDSDAAQRAGEYLPETMRHPHPALPAIPAQAIRRYTEIGQTVFDPVGGETTAVEAARTAAARAPRRTANCDSSFPKPVSSKGIRS